MERLLAGPTNARPSSAGRKSAFRSTTIRPCSRPCRARCSNGSTARGARPSATRSSARAGSIAGISRIPGFRCGNVVVLIQPARGYDIDPKATYHDPALVPPHAYLAFYAWLADEFRADAVIHLGKHGNLEWLPGKALALSAECLPEVALGPLPHLYPFIVNDPGEGTQAKRRAQAVIVDHLTPPMTRADSYGALAELERADRRILRGRARRSAPRRAARRRDPGARRAPRARPRLRHRAGDGRRRCAAEARRVLCAS